MLQQEFYIATQIRVADGLEGKDLKFIEDLMRQFTGKDRKTPLTKEQIKHLDALIEQFGIDISEYDLKKLRTQQRMELEKENN